MLTDYTTYNDIRSALGVSVDEIDDVTLALEMHDNHLRFELDEVNANLASAYATVVAIAPATRSAAQAKLYRATRLFATLAVANSLAGSLPMFGPKDISDGKATVSRFADAPYKAVIKAVQGQYGVNRDRVKQAYAELISSASVSTARSYMSAARPVTDPVVG